MNRIPEPTRIPIVFQGDADEGAQAADAMAVARSAQAQWSRSPMSRRLGLIYKLRQLIVANARWLAEASASARGRPESEVLVAEVLPLADACRFLERRAEKVLAPQRLGRYGRPLWLTGTRCEIHREPYGVVLIIGPGNYPLFLPGVQMIQALAAGNAVLLKPAIGGTVAAGRLCELIARAGFDPRLSGLLPESSQAAQAAIAAGPDKVLFTGSAAIGERILAALAPRLIPATMELSGCDAVIVRSDADLDLTAKALKFSLELNGGATCLAPKRVFVARDVATELERRLSHLWDSTANGDRQPMKYKNHTRPIRETVRSLIEGAVAGGARFVSGGISREGFVTLPVILAGVSPGQRLLREDVFAPVLSLVIVADDNEAIAQVNRCPFALSAAIFSRDETAARALARQVNAGTVTINDLIVPTADARLPFGGRKRSGFGVTRGAEGLLELTVPKTVTITRGRFRPAFEPPHPADMALFRSYLSLVHGCDLKTRARALISLIQTICNRKRSTSTGTT